MDIVTWAFHRIFWDFVFAKTNSAQSTRLHAIDLYAPASFCYLFPFTLLLLGWS